MAAVWECSRHSGSHLLMLLAVADFSDDDGKAYPSVAALARKCRMQSRNANVILAALRASGELEVRLNAGPHGTNLYRVRVSREGLQRLAGGANPCRVQRLAPTPAKACSKPLQGIADEPSLNHQEPPVARKRATSPRAGRFDAAAIELPDWLPREAWADWAADRAERRKPITKRAAEQQVKRLASLRDEGHDPAAVIRHSIASGYQGLYPERSSAGQGRAASASCRVLNADEVLR